VVDGSNTVGARDESNLKAGLEDVTLEGKLINAFCSQGSRTNSPNQELREPITNEELRVK
jgi:hypothetical protein